MVVMEATGDHWKPFHCLVEDAPFELMSVNAARVCVRGAGLNRRHESQADQPADTTNHTEKTQKSSRLPAGLRLNIC